MPGFLVLGVPAAVPPLVMRIGAWLVTAVMIGIDPHKGSHTAVAISRAEEQLGRLRVGAGADQAGRLIEWAAGWPDRRRAVENATGLGHLLAQQLVAAGERVPGHPAQARRPGPGAGGREHAQERPE